MIIYVKRLNIFYFESDRSVGNKLMISIIKRPIISNNLQKPVFLNVWNKKIVTDEETNAAGHSVYTYDNNNYAPVECNDVSLGRGGVG